MTLISILGISAAVLTTGSNIPQAWKTIKTGDTKSLAIGTFSLLLLGTALWCVYGFFNKRLSDNDREWYI